MYSQNERIAFNTYLIVDNQPTFVIQWSRQFDSEGKLFYQINPPYPINQLPSWAISICTEDPYLSNSDHNDQKLTYLLPPALLKSLSNEVADSPLYQLQNSLLPPTHQWCFVQQQPDLFPSVLITASESTSHKHSYPAVLSTYGVRENKVTGPRVAGALERIAEDYGSQTAIEIANKFREWAESHNRHFNMQEINQFIEKHTAAENKTSFRM